MKYETIGETEAMSETKRMKGREVREIKRRDERQEQEKEI